MKDRCGGIPPNSSCQLTTNTGNPGKPPGDPCPAKREDHDGQSGGEGVHGQPEDPAVDGEAGGGGEAPGTDSRGEEGVGDPPSALRPIRHKHVTVRQQDCKRCPCGMTASLIIIQHDF